MAASSRAKLLLGAVLVTGCGAAEGSATLAAPAPRGSAPARGAMRAEEGAQLDVSCAATELPRAQGAALASRFVYAANQNSHDVSAYAVAPSGALSPLGAPVPVGSYPQSLALLPDAKSLLVANRGSGTVSVLSVDERGLLQPRGPELTDAGSAPIAVAAHPNGRLVFVGSDDATFSAKNTVTTYAVQADGGLRRAASSETQGTGLLALSLDGSGKLLFTANALSDDVSAFSVDPCTGELARVGSFATAPFPVALGVDASGEHLYVASSGGEPAVQTFAIDAESGSLRLLATLKVAFPPWSLRAMRLDAASGSLVLLSLGERGAAFISTLAVDADRGWPLSAPITSLAAGENAGEIALGPSGRFAYVGNFGSNDVSSYALDPERGTVTHLGSVPAGSAPNALAIAARPTRAEAP